MSLPRQGDNIITRKNTADTSSHAEIYSSLLESTKKIQEALRRRGSEQLEANQPETPHYPPAAAFESGLMHSTKHSDILKDSLEIKNSSHTVEIVQFNDRGCDLIACTSFSDIPDLNQLTGQSNACYVVTADKQIYYINKQVKSVNKLNIEADKFDNLMEALAVKFIDGKTTHFMALTENLSAEQLQKITDATQHMHGMSFYKHKQIDSVMSQLEAANSIAYQLLGPRHFPTCYAVCDESHHYVGVLSKFLPGFKPNRDKPLQEQNLEIFSLKNMIKDRDDHEKRQIGDIINTVKNLIPLLKRDANPNDRFIYRIWTRTVNAGNYYLGDQYSAQHVKPILEAFTKQNVPTITFGKLESIRQLLVNRKANIEQVKSKYIAQQHQHDTELPLINQAIDQLNLILLDEIALFMKQLYKIDRDLQNAWVDIESEKSNPNSKYHNIQISKELGLVADLHVSLDDIQHFRIQIGQAIGLTSRYFLLDPDCHAKNLACDGRNVDGDLAVYPLTYRFKVPNRKPGPNDYVLDLNDYMNFPNLSAANFRYWPTKATILDKSADAALSQVSEVTKNYFTDQDIKNFQDLEKCPVFNFQKYIQLIAFSLIDADMLTACAKLHMSDQLPMLNEDGDVNAPLPLTNSSGQRQDILTNWVEMLTMRSQDARHKLAAELPQVKMILARHREFVLELIQDHFKLFMNDRKNELNEEAMNQLQNAIDPEKISASFDALISELSPEMVANSSNTYQSGVLSI